MLISCGMCKLLCEEFDSVKGCAKTKKLNEVNRSAFKITVVQIRNI